MGFLKRGLDDLATLDVGNVPYTVGFKVCIYTIPLEYGDFIVKSMVAGHNYHIFALQLPCIPLYTIVMHTIA